MERVNAVLQDWSLWTNLYCAQRRLLRKERLANGKVKRHHEKHASTPAARLLARADLLPEHRRKLRALLAAHDPITLKARIERRLKAVYALRAKLLAQEGQPDLVVAAVVAAVTPQPAAAKPRPPAGGRAVRSVASGSRRSRRGRPPGGAKTTAVKKPLPTPASPPKNAARTGSATARHRAAP